MRRILFVLVLAVLAVLTIPPLRERARPQIEYVLNPVYRWNARNRVNEISRALERERGTGGVIPTASEFHRFISTREGEDATIDPWGQPYFLQASRRDYVIGSHGQDRERGTADDVLSTPRSLLGTR